MSSRNTTLYQWWAWPICCQFALLLVSQHWNRCQCRCWIRSTHRNGINSKWSDVRWCLSRKWRFKHVDLVSLEDQCTSAWVNDDVGICDHHAILWQRSVVADRYKHATNTLFSLSIPDIALDIVNMEWKSGTMATTPCGKTKPNYGFNPVGKCESNWIISPGRVKNQTYLSCHHLENKENTFS